MNLETRFPLSTRPSLLQLFASLPAPVQNVSLAMITIKCKFVVASPSLSRCLCVSVSSLDLQI